MVRSILKQMVVVCGFLSCLQVATEAKAYYASHQGRFINRDPIGYPDGMNSYAAYFAPNSMDPSGLCTQPEETCEIKVCVKQVNVPLGVAYGHMYLILPDQEHGSVGYRGGPLAKSDNLNAGFYPYKKGDFPDHPDNEIGGNLTKQCDTYRVKGSCKEIAKCLQELADDIKNEPVQYNPYPKFNKNDLSKGANSNSVIRWGMEGCLSGKILSGQDESGKKIDVAGDDYYPKPPNNNFGQPAYNTPGFDFPLPDRFR